MGLNWLITGGCGFLGTALVRSLRQSDANRVRVVDNLIGGTRDDLNAAGGTFTERAVDSLKSDPEGLELVVADIRDRMAMVAVTKGIDIVVHLAANTGVGPSVKNPYMDCEVNVMGTLCCLDGARVNGVKRFVFASSGAPIGEVEPPIHEELPAHPVSPYGASKLAGEGYCSAYARCYGLETVALRFGNVYGPGSKRKESVVAKFVSRAMRRETLEVYGDGGQTRDFIYVGDLIEAISLAAVTPGIGGETFQIATSRETTIAELIDVLLPIIDGSGIDLPVIIHTEARQGDVRRNFSDTRKASRLLGWEARTELAEGLQITVEDLLNCTR